VMVGDVMHDIDRVDAAAPAMMDAAGMHFRFLGEEWMEKLARESGWQVGDIDGENPFYVIFSLAKIS